jgi:hypothetical protein
MANLTLSIDEHVLHAARVRAVKEGTSVNEICRRALEAYAGREGDRLARYRALRERIDGQPGARGAALPRLDREQLYRELFDEISGTDELSGIKGAKRRRS